MLKDMVKGEASGVGGDSGDDEKKQKLKFSATIAKILLKHFEQALHGRGVFIILELLENPATTTLVAKHLKAQKKVIQDIAKKDSKAKGLQVLLKKVSQAWSFN